MEKIAEERLAFARCAGEDCALRRQLGPIGVLRSFIWRVACIQSSSRAPRRA
ncbi:hypothetical protein A2U01_0101474, partial [Trifolium medium]|nr:hypothetical protein [Trifolium medium]